MVKNFLALAFLAVSSASLASSSCLDNNDPCAVFTWNGQEYCVERYELDFVDGYIPPSSGLSQVTSSAMRKAWSNQASRCMYNESFNGLFSNKDFSAKTLPDQLSFIEKTLEKIEVLTAKHPVVRERIIPTRKYIADTLLPKYAGPVREFLKLLSQVDASLESFQNKISIVLNHRTSTRIKEETYKVLCSDEAGNRLAELEDRCNSNGDLCDLRLLYAFIQDCTNTSSLDQALDKIAALSTANITARETVKKNKSDLERAQQLILSISASSETIPNPDTGCENLELIGVGPINFNPTTEKRYGIDTRFLVGEWNFQELGSTTTVTKGRYHVMRVADHARRCFLDSNYGRISYPVFEQKSSENLETYTNRVFESLLVIGRAFAESRQKLSPSYLLRFGISAEEDIRYMQANHDETRLNFQQAVLSQRGAGWLISMAALYDTSVNHYLSILEKSKLATLEYMNQGAAPIDYATLLAILTDQTSSLLNSYEIFFSHDAKQRLDGKLEKLKALTPEELSADNAATLLNLILEIEAQAKDTFKDSEVFQLVSTKLTSLFGCPLMNKTYTIFEQLQNETLREKLFNQCGI